MSLDSHSEYICSLNHSTNVYGVSTTCQIQAYCQTQRTEQKIYSFLISLSLYSSGGRQTIIVNILCQMENTLRKIIKQQKWNEYQFGMNAILDRMAKKSLTDKVIFEHTSVKDERVIHTDMKGKQFFIMRKQRVINQNRSSSHVRKQHIILIYSKLRQLIKLLQY